MPKCRLEVTSLVLAYYVYGMTELFLKDGDFADGAWTGQCKQGPRTGNLTFPFARLIQGHPQPTFPSRRMLLVNFAILATQP